MGRGGAIYFSYVALVLLSAQATATSNAGDLWVVNIDNGPAPSPENGPPLSYNASRDKALLPYQILGIAGGYLGFVLILGSILLTIGRRLRKQARWLIDRDPNDTEMTKPMAHVMDPSPLSYRSQYTFAGKKSAASSTVTVLPMPRNGASFDADVLRRDRDHLQNGLADIYGAVYDAEERRGASSPVVQVSRPTDLRLTTDLAPSRTPPTQYPPRGSSSGSAHQRQISVTNFSKPMSPINPAFAPAAEQSQLRGPYGIQAVRSEDSRIAPRTHLDGYDEDMEETLPPQYYFEPRSPDTATARTPEIHQIPPTVPANAFDWNDPYSVPAERPRAWPQPNPQRSSAAPYGAQKQMSSLPEDEIGSTPLRELRAARSAGNVHNTLPLRQRSDKNLRSTGLMNTSNGGSRYQSRTGEALLSPGLVSPGPIQQRILDVPDNPFMRSIPTGMRTPLTGGLMSTQSQFKQYNHAETRSERKQREREERATHGVIPEGMVPDDEEMWMSNY